MTSIKSELEKILPKDSLLSDESDLIAYGMDWTKVAGKASLVVLPRTTKEVAAVLHLCSQFKQPVIASGGRTGLAAGAVALNGELVLSLSRMNKLSEIDHTGRTLRVQAGATTQSVHEHAAKEGLTWPIDLAAKGTSEIGGNLSTNAGGVRVIRYGMTRKWVSALQIVTTKGEIIELNQGLEKNNTGYDLIQLMIGAEGTLAVITEATLKLCRLPEKKSVMLFSLESFEKINALLIESRKGPFEIVAFEFFSKKCSDAVEKQLGRKTKLQHTSHYHLLMEIEIPYGGDAQIRVDEWLEKILSSDIVKDGMIAGSSEEESQIWGLREGITESLSKTAPVKKYDVAVPVKNMAAFLNEAEILFKKENFKVDLYIFGHFGDGSPHLNILQQKDTTLEFYESECKRVEASLYPLIKKYNGSASAEHGVGLLKKSWVTYSRTPQELAFFKSIKRAFDPDNILNPGKLIDL